MSSSRGSVAPRPGSSDLRAALLRATRLLAALLLAAPLLGCARSPVRAAPEPARGPEQAPAVRPAIAAETARPPLDASTQRLGNIDLLLVEWDKAQLSGDTDRAARVAARLRTEVDAAWPDLLAGLEGGSGDDGRYLATMALGFASRPDATALLVKQLLVSDPRLVANALIGLKLRSDPTTPLEPLVRHIASPVLEVKRYAPLAFAHVLAARRRAGLAPDATAESGSLKRLSASTRDRDVLVRLHAARALGELAQPDAVRLLRSMLSDASTRIQLAAATGLGRQRDDASFSEVVRMLHEAPEQGKPIVADVLVGFAENLQGRALSAEERAALGTNTLAWTRWYAGWMREQPAGAAGAPAR